MFRTIGKTNNTSGKLVGVKLTQTLLDINEAWHDVNDASATLEERFETIDNMMSDMNTLSNLATNIQKTKLQPSICAYLGSMESISTITGVDFKAVNSTNRNKMTRIAVEAIDGEKKSLWERIKTWLKNMWIAVKGFFARLFRLSAKQAAAIKKLKEDVVAKIKDADEKDFAAATMKGYTKTVLNGMVAPLAAIEKQIKSVDINKFDPAKAEKALKKDIDTAVFGGLKAALKAVGYELSEGKLKKSQIDTKKDTMKALGYKIADAKDLMENAGKLLGNITKQKHSLERMEMLVKQSLKHCDVAAVANKTKEDDERAKAETAQLALKSYSALVNAYVLAGSKYIDQAINIVSKIKIKK